METTQTPENQPIKQTTPPDLTKPTTDIPATKKPPKNMKIWIIAIVLLLLAVLGAGIVLAYFLLIKDSDSSDDAKGGDDGDIVEDDVDSPDDDTDDDDDTDFGPRKIAYLKNDNVWIMETDGTNKTQITFDGDGDATRYTAVDWKERGTLGYAKCDGDCNIYTYDLTADTELLAHTTPPFTQHVSDITWTHDTTKLGYIITKADYSYEAILASGAGTTSIASFGIPPARGGGNFDGIQIRFSPDDTKIVVLNTIVEPGEDTIIATQIDGTPITTIAGATHPTFDGNSGFYFISEDMIKKYTFATDTIGNVLFFAGTGGYNLETSPDRNFISYWNEDAAGEGHLYFHDVAGSPALIADGFANAKWIDNSYLVAIKTDINELGMGYLSDGLSKVARVGGAESVLETDPVYTFEIEPE
ncbi:hypothetical protein JW978_02130 [Candidatus Dojkabacteria bacterium]|nr:hypothetical protein [Candidatus Dojkabacteria bacterium]